MNHVLIDKTRCSQWSKTTYASTLPKSLNLENNQLQSHKHNRFLPQVRVSSLVRQYTGDDLFPNANMPHNQYIPETGSWAWKTLPSLPLLLSLPKPKVSLHQKRREKWQCGMAAQLCIAQCTHVTRFQSRYWDITSMVVPFELFWMFIFNHCSLCWRGRNVMFKEEPLYTPVTSSIAWLNTATAGESPASLPCQKEEMGNQAL